VDGSVQIVRSFVYGKTTLERAIDDLKPRALKQAERLVSRKLKERGGDAR
jgi:hypothetical protein